MPRFLAIGLLALAQENPASPPPAPPPAPPSHPSTVGRPAVRNLVIVTLDTVRADHLGCYGYFRDTTPALDALAKECLRFTRCLAPIAQTTPSHASLFTGVMPFEHGVLSNFFSRPEDERELLSLRTSATLATLAQALKAKGLKTGGFVGAAPVKRFTGLAEGFETWTEPEVPRRIGREVIADAVKFIDECGEAPWFAWVHLFDAHGPIRPPRYPPKEYFSRYRTDPKLEAWLETRRFTEILNGENSGPTPSSQANNMYDGALRFLDDQFAELSARLRKSDVWDHSAIVVVADHGQGLGQHGAMTHGLCWDEHFRVPLLIHVPGLEPGTSDVLCSLIDVVPTVFALAPALADESFLAQCRGADVLAGDFEPRPIFGMSPYDKGQTSITTTKWKLIRKRDVSLQLFDRDADPFELEDVSAAHKDVVERLLRMLDAEVARQQEAERIHHAGMSDEGELDPRIREQLKELGYVEGEDEDEAPPRKPDDGR